MVSRPFITLTTDFGTRDYFVGSLKGVILGIHPEARIIDISHEVGPQNILEAAFLLKSAYRYFPRGSVHVVIVDPGVGGRRRPILAVSEDYFFVAPDNGVLSWVIAESGAMRVYEITESRFFLKSRGRTFDGRDLFCPVAAWLSRGIEPEQFGKEIRDFRAIEIPAPTLKGNGQIDGQVLYIDHFGNIITNITAEHLKPFEDLKDRLEVNLLTDCIYGLKKTYSDSPPGEAGALVNSCGHLEVYLNLGQAAARLKTAVGDPVKIRISKSKM
jgi:S-adenosylmethionine hydrolase